MTSFADQICLAGLKAGIFKTKSSSLQPIPEERTAVLSPQASDPSMTLTLLVYVSALYFSFQRVGVFDWIACHVATPVTRKEGCR